MLLLTLVRCEGMLWEGPCKISALQNYSGLGQLPVGTAVQQTVRPIGRRIFGGQKLSGHQKLLFGRHRTSDV